ncbi:tellurite resistance TerB family protein [Pelistega ratti]|nr:tellurite resistance TerB family protein [Pelistega ratti]
MSAFNILEQLLGKNLGSIVGDFSQQAKNATQTNSINQLQTKGLDIFNQIKEATMGEKSVLGSGDKKGLALSALAVLLGSKADSSLIKLGGLAGLGTIAYQAYQRWQAQQNGTVAPTTSEPPTLSYTPSELEQTSKALLVAMINAAKADGHIQEEEKAQLDQQLSQIQSPQDKAWFQAEVARPVDPAYVASFANQKPELSAQIYAMSLSICNDQNFMEKAYLDELAKQLNIADDLKVAIEQQVKEALNNAA